MKNPSLILQIKKEDVSSQILSVVMFDSATVSRRWQSAVHLAAKVAGAHTAFAVPQSESIRTRSNSGSEGDRA